MDTNSDQTSQLDFLSPSEAPAHTPSSAEPAQTPQAPVTESNPLLTGAPEALQTPAHIEPQPEAPRMVPLSELLDTRKRAQAAEEAQRQTALQAQQLTEMLARYTQPQQQPQRQPEPIDPDVDPGAYIRDLEARMAHNMHVQQLNFSEQRAREKFGDEIVNKATEAAVQSGYNQLFLNKPDAYKELVTWYQGQQVSQEIGDPTQYRQRLETELRAKIIAEMRQGTPPPANLPPSFAGSTKAAYAAPVVEDAGDFFKTMMNRR